MTYTSFAEKMLIALYQEADSTDHSYSTLGELAKRYGLAPNERWLERLSDEWKRDGLAEVHAHLGSPLQWGVEITGRGMRAIEADFGDKDEVGTILEPVQSVPSNALLTDSGEPLITEDGDFIVTEDEEELGTIPASVSSEAWTGIADRLERDPIAVKNIKVKLEELDREVNKLELSNHERSKVKAITEALTKLVESPEPEWKAIVELLRSPTLSAILGLAGITQLALKIIFGIG